MENKDIRITSVDNPYDPFTHWDEWLLFDANAGYNTCGRLASITIVSDAMTAAEVYEEVERGIELLMKTGSINKNGEIVEYKKVIKTNSH
jgi:hypothetical protein